MPGAGGAELLLGLHTWFFLVDDVQADFALAITAANHFVVFVALFQRLE